MAGRFPAATRLTAALLAVTLGLGGCASGGVLTWEPETPEQRELRERAEALQSTVGEGSLAGAAAGAVIGGLAGGVSGAFSGAQIGRFGGAAAGGYVRELQEEYSEEEALLEQMAADVRATNEELEETIAVMRDVLAERRETLARLRAEADADESRAAALERQIERTNTSLEDMKLAVAGAEKRGEFFGEARGLVLVETAAPPAAASGLDTQISGLSDRIAAMRSIADQLAREL